ncbi:MAG: HAMP domain-containing protein, partial [Armatimonadetes bacterium]|nr:HAMP domain-containing protein [Armatimonadota bacterium]
MKIKTKIAVALAVVSTATMALYYFVQRPQLISKFEELQRTQAKEDLFRARDAVLTQVEALHRQGQDWASWDDSYEYVKDHNQDFAKANLAGPLFTTTHFDLIYIIDRDGKIVFGKSQLPDGKIVDTVAGLDTNLLALGTAQTPGPALDAKRNLQGIDYFQGYPVVLSARPILDSAEQKEPRGALIVGRYLTTLETDAMHAKTGVKFELLSPKIAESAVSLDPSAASVQTTNVAISNPKIGIPEIGYTYLLDPFGKKSILVRSATSTKVLEKGVTSIERTFQSMVLASLVAALMGLLAIHRSVVAPLQKLARQVQATDNQFSDFISNDIVRRSDEIGELAQSFTDLMGRLESTNSQLQHASREAGMAEVARGVLHNAGNVLNSVSVSVRQVELVAGRLNPSGLGKALTLMNENAGNLDEFLARDPKGMKVLAYLNSLSENLDKEHAELVAEAKSLANSTGHLCQVVQGQAVFAAKPNMQSEFRLAKVVQEVHSILEKGLDRHGVRLVHEVDDAVTVTGDPSQFLQILVNLVTNAKDAMKATPLKERVVEVNTRFTDSGEIELRVKDNGSGIRQEDAETIFSHGFSTKENGLG